MIPERALRHASVSAQRKIKIDDTLKSASGGNTYTHTKMDFFVIVLPSVIRFTRSLHLILLLIVYFKTATIPTSSRRFPNSESG